MIRFAAPGRCIRLAVVLACIPFSSCIQKGRKEIDPAFAQFISAFTSGTLSAASPIRIQFTIPAGEGVETGVPLDEEILQFSPDIPGELVWTDARTLEFRPSEWLRQGETYDAELRLDRIMSVPRNLASFDFSFSVLQQQVSARLTSVRPCRAEELRRLYASGTLLTLDVCTAEAAEKCLMAEQDGRRLPIRWTHAADLRTHSFEVDSITRGEKAGKIMLKWDGEPAGAEQRGSATQEIPSLGDFRVFMHEVVQQPEQYVSLHFSDPIDPGQNLDGLIELPGAANLRFSTDLNEVRIYPSYRLTGEMTLLVHAGIRNTLGYASTAEQSFALVFEDLKPAVEHIDGEKVILPSTDGMVIPFRSVNLSAVDVRVIRVFESNIPQFLQINELDGDSEMKRVGRQVARKTIQLNASGANNLSQWNTHYLDLDEIIRSEPGAIYRVEIGFRKEHSTYPCDGSSSGPGTVLTETDQDEDQAEAESSYWDYYDDYWYGDEFNAYYDYDYDWEQRDNPCDESYFKYRRPVGRNIMASDLAVITKKGNDHSMECYVTDVRSTDPVGEAEVEVLNYQQQPLFRGRTNGEGRLSIPSLKGVPFLLVARKGKHSAYLKLDNGHALSMSTFDVSGASPQKGLKGFIYGERGVWRPGDTLHLAFMLQDRDATIPTGHPVNFEVTDPRGRVVHKAVKPLGAGSILSFPVVLSSDAPTGNYFAQAKVGGASFTRSLRVETIKPNRLRIAFGAGLDKIAAGRPLTAGLDVKWLHGAPARNIRATITAVFHSAGTHFERYTDYVFDDPVRSFPSEETVVFDGQLNSEGHADVPLQVRTERNAPGMLNASFSIKAFEEGGDFSTDRATIPFAPYEVFAGLRLPKGDASRGMLLTDTDQRCDVVTVDAQGKPAGNRKVSWRVYKVSWRWWWEESADDLTNYVGSESNVPVAEGTCQTGADGRGNFSFQVRYPDWGRYLVRIEDAAGGHAAGETVYLDWPGWAGRAQRQNPEGASMLAFSMDKTQYGIGEWCQLSIPSASQGRILVSVENGSRVLDSWWVTPEKDQTVFRFRTTGEMSPNAYVHVTLIQPHAQSMNDAPIRMYGIQPLLVRDPQSRLEPQILTASEYAPDKDFSVRICERNGRAMSYTLAVVDEGLLDLTRFPTPDPWEHFNAREALGVNTYDVYDEVIGAQAVRADRLISIGGSDEAGSRGRNRANRFKPVVLYLGPFSMKAGECKNHQLHMPNYVGSVRVMVVASQESSYGSSELSVPVRKPLMVLATLPRVISPGEEVDLPVTVFAMDKSVRKVDLEVVTDGLLTLSGPNRRSAQFTEDGDQVIPFTLRVKDQEGTARVEVRARSGNHSATYRVEIDVRNPNPPQTIVTEAVVEAGKSYSTQIAPPGMPGTNSTLLEVSTMPAIDFGRRIRSLLDYPHGCAEQTTSQAFPQLFLAEVIDLGKKEQLKAAENVRAALRKLSGLQSSTGGITYWPGQSEADDWATSYAGHFMLEARKRGFNLPTGMESGWLRYQRNRTREWSAGSSPNRSDDLIQAYRLFTLALAGQPEMGAMNRLREQKGLSDAARWQLAGAYALCGQKSTGQALVSRTRESASPYPEAGATFGSALRDEAIIAETLLLLGDKVRAAPLIKRLSTGLSGSEWMSTQTTAFALIAVSRFVSAQPGRELRFTARWNGKALPEVRSGKTVSQVPVHPVEKSNSLQIQNTSGNVLYVRVISTGKPESGKEQPVTKGIRMNIRYVTIEGRPLQVGSIEQGTDFYADVSVTHTGSGPPYQDLALTQVFPSGWEIINARLDPGLTLTGESPADYQDYRDDRVLTYFDLPAGKTRRFRVKLNASYAGRFYYPGASCEAMYDFTRQCRMAGQWVEVVRPSGQAVVSR